jgi:thiol-disulfide isomerase/thioredoxin
VEGRTDHRSAEQVLAEIKAVAIPQRIDNPEALKVAREAWHHKSDLILKLFRMAPDHPELPALMHERWWRSGGRDKSEVIAECDEVLARSKDETLRSHARYWKAFRRASSAGSEPHERDGAKAAIEEFIRLAPKDERGARLLYTYVRPHRDPPADQADVFKRIIRDYAASPEAKLVEGLLRKRDGVGKPFELEFTDATRGTRVSTKDMRGKVVVVNYWATWCGPCKSELPRLKALYREFRPMGVEFIGVSLDYSQRLGGSPEKFKEFVKENEISWPQYYQGDGWESEFSTSWGITSIPRAFVIDQAGKVYSTQADSDLETIILYFP